MTSYRLLKAGKDWKGTGTHLSAALQALKALGGEATAAEVTEYVEKHELLRGSKMETKDAIGWILVYGVKVGVLKAKESK